MNEVQQTSAASSLNNNQGRRRLLVFIKGRHHNEPVETRAKADEFAKFATTSLLCAAALMIVAVLIAYVRGRL